MGSSFGWVPNAQKFGKKFFEFDSISFGYYVLLSNMYANMEDGKMLKELGSSRKVMD